MSQKWNRTSPLHWFDTFLSWLIAPFSRAKKIEIYATNGYFLMGLVLAAVISLFWGVGLLGLILTQLPASVHDILKGAFGAIGWLVPPESVLLVGLIVFIYWLLYFIKQVRLLVGETFAKLFFGTINVAITMGEWCLEHRWSSLFIVIVLAGFITWGTFYVFEARGRNEQLRDKFALWQRQVKKFSTQNKHVDDETAKYQEEVSPFWDDKFSNIIGLPGHDPGFTLHKMLDVLYSQSSPEKQNWVKFLRDHIGELKGLMDGFKPPDIQMMTPNEKQSWAWMNILMGRIYVRLCEDSKVSNGCSDFKNAMVYFGKVAELDQFLQDKNENYRLAAHNGMGTLYANALDLLIQDPNSTMKEICPYASTCANNALKEYAEAGGTGCSFEGVRRENNNIDLLLRIGFGYEYLNKGQGIDLYEVCSNKHVEKESDLAACMETRSKNLLGCVAGPGFFPNANYVTAAQAYGVIAKLRLVDADPDVRHEAEAAGSYLRLVFTFDTKEDIENEDFRYFSPFLIGKDQQCPSQEDEGFQRVYKKDAYKCVFWDALRFGFDKSMTVDWKNVEEKIRSDLNKKSKKN